MNIRISDGRPEALNQIRNFRCRLLAHHLGHPASHPQVAHPWDDASWAGIRATAGINSDILAAVFPTFPHSGLTSEEDIRNAGASGEGSGSTKTQSLRNLVGFMVMYPLHYLEKENLRSQQGGVTGFLPSQLQSVFQ